MQLIVTHREALAVTFAFVVGGSQFALATPVAKRKGPMMLGKKAGEVRTFGVFKIKMCWCPPGTFMMGSPDTEKYRDDNEGQVKVTLTNGFWMNRTEVTKNLWKKVMGTEPWKGKPLVRIDQNYPVEYVSHAHALSFCAKLTERERKAGRLSAKWSYRLPTEAEWEYACRAGTKSAYSFGADWRALGNYAWYTNNAWDIDERYAHAPASKKPNAWGLYDMHGNVFEWCQDWYGEKLSGGRNPHGPGKGKRRVIRGGGWRSIGSGCRSAYRTSADQYAKADYVGFRIVLAAVGK